MYHVIANLELKFNNLNQAVRYASAKPFIIPAIPATMMSEEDRNTPRICVAPTIEDCITAIGLFGTFRRCLNDNPDTKSYENDDEAYPILILEFENGGEYTPDKHQVPDVETTHEHWLLNPAKPKKISLKWLNSYSIKIQENENGQAICKSVKFLESTENYHHPWLDGAGHPLESSDMGSDPWPSIDITPMLYYHGLNNGAFGFMTPIWPANGQCIFTPIDKKIKPYRTFIHQLRKFTGLYDKENLPIIEDKCVEIEYTIEYTNQSKTASVSYFEDGRCGLIINDASRRRIYFTPNDPIAKRLHVLTPFAKKIY